MNVYFENIIFELELLEPKGKCISFDVDSDYNITHYKDSLGFEYWINYINGLESHYADNNGLLYVKTYYDNGKLKSIYYNYPNGCYSYFIYDLNNNITLHKNDLYNK